MSETYATFSARVRNIVNDIDPTNYVIPDDLLMETVNSIVLEIGNDVNPGVQWLGSPVTLVAGTSDYTLNTANQYAQVIVVRRGSDKFPLIKRTVAEQSDAWIGANTPRGPLVIDYAIWEDDSQHVNIRVRPVPTQADTLEIFYSDLPTPLSNATVSPTIPYSYPLTMTAANGVAARLVAKMTQADAERLGIDKGAYGAELKEAYEHGKVAETERINRLKRIGRVQKVDR